MKKKQLLLGLSLASLSLGVVAPAINPSHHLVYADDKKVIDRPLMSIGGSLSDEEVQQTKRLLGDTGISDKDVLRVDGSIISKYISGVNSDAQIFSSAYIKPMEKGYGVQVEIVTPTKITKVSSATFQNAAITSGITDVLIRVASVNEVTGEGALAGVYALLENAGIKVEQESIQISQNEMGLIGQLKDETKVSDADANQILGQLKKKVSQRVSKKEEVTDTWLKEQIEAILKEYKLSLSDKVLETLLAWLRDYSGTNVAKKKATIVQLNQSLLSEDWASSLASLDKVLTPEEILKLKRQDYSNSDIYDAIIDKIYQRLLKDIEDEDLASVKLIYSHSFVLDKILKNPSREEKEALNYIRMLCYYFIAHKEDGKLQEVRDSGKAPAWLRYTTTKENFLYTLQRYQELGQLPELQELLNRIAQATGYSYEAFLYDDISQKDDVVTLTIVCPCLNAKQTIRVTYNLKTGACRIKVGKKVTSTKFYDFKGYYGQKVENHYQHLVDDISQYKLLSDEKSLVSQKAKNKAARQAYKQVLDEYVTYSESSDSSLDGYQYLNKDDLTMNNIQEDRNFTYGFVDINKDGLDELIVTTVDRSEQLIGLYSFDGEKPVFLHGSIYRSGVTIHEDGIVRQDGSGSAFYSITTLHRLNTHGTLDRIFTISREFDTDKSGNKVYIVDGDDSGEKYYNDQDVIAKYPKEASYLSSGMYTMLEYDKPAPLMDFSGFKDKASLLKKEDQEEVTTTSSEKKLSKIFKLNQKDKPKKKTEDKSESGQVSAMNEEQIKKGNYTSIEGYWESEDGGILYVNHYGLNPEFKDLNMGETRKLDDINETEFNRTYSEDDGNLVDGVHYTRSVRSIYYKYVPKGKLYSPRWQGEKVKATEDIILHYMNGMTEDYTIYRRRPYAEAKAIVQHAVSEGGVVFSPIPKNLILERSEYTNNLSIFSMDIANVIDYFNTYNATTYELGDVLKAFTNMEERSGKLGDLNQSDLESLARDNESFNWIYFKGDKQLIFFMPITGHAGAFPRPDDESTWTITDDTLIIPLLGFDNSSVGQIVLKKNDKNYKGGKKKSTYYVYEWTKDN